MTSQQKLGTFPLSNEAYDVITMLQAKSQALKAYDQYLQDVRQDTALTQLLVQMRHEDQTNVERLTAHLARLLKSAS